MSILDVKSVDTDETLALSDTKDMQSAEEANIASQVCGLIMEKFNYYSTARFQDEETWMRCWRNFRGIYGPQVRYTDTEKSQVFVKITKTKTMAAIGQIMDVLLSSGDFPVSIEPTKKPEGISDLVNVKPDDGKTEDEPEAPSDPYGYHGDGKELAPGSTHASLLGQGLGEEVEEGGLKVENGPAIDEFAVQLDPAAISAKAMEKTIKDQLDETDATFHLRDAVFEMAILGSGCIKGVFTTTKTYNQWTKNPESQTLEYTPLERDRPMINATSIWNVYPDPEANIVGECPGLIERHGKSAQQLRALTDRPGFRSEVIEYILENYHPDYVPMWFEHELKDFNRQPTTNRYTVLEYWGTMDKKLAEQFDITIPKEFEKKKEVFVNACICCNQVIRFVLNPFVPTRIPYLIAPYERNPYKIWGVGVPENMEDSQLIMNGHARMAIDNLALAGNVVFEVDETYMTNTEDMRIYPGRVFRRQGGPPGQSIYAIKFPSTTQENLQMFDKFRELADEATNIPSISHGQTGITGTTRTSSGMSMIMNASTVAIKTVIRNIDDFFIRPLGESFFAWNMQFNPDVDIHGDLEVRARGTSSLMQKEVRTQRLMMFMQVGSNPTLAPFVNWYTVLKEVAKDLDLDPEKFTNNIEQAKLQALIQRAHNNLLGVGPTSADPTQQVPAPGAPPQSPQGQTPTGIGSTPSVKDPQGKGNGGIGAGGSSTPGEQGFSASPQ